MSDSSNLKDQLGKVTEIVNDAVRTGDYSQLSGQIANAVDKVTDTLMGNPVDAEYEPIGNSPDFEAGPGRRDGNFWREAEPGRRDGNSGREAEPGRTGGSPAGGQYRRQTTWADAQAEHARQMRREAEQRKQEKLSREAYENTYFAKPEDQTGDSVLQVIGVLIAVCFMLLTIVNIAITAYGGVGLAPLPVVTGLITAGGIFLARRGRRAARKKQHFKAYRNLLLPNLYMDVKDLARKTRVPKDEVVADLEEFTEKGMIRQGHFDAKKKTFIASDEIYKQYAEMEERSAELKRAQKAEEKKKKEEEKRKAAESAKYTDEVRTILDEGNRYIENIHAANDAIEDEAVSEKLDRMERIVRRIFEEVRERPDLASRLGMFTDYYLPTTTKLIWAYDDLTRQPVQGENISAARHEIEASLDTINDAFEKLLDSFFKEKAMDVSSDISVMKMMMKQDGLTDDDLTASMKKKGSGGTQQAAQTPVEAQSRQTIQTSGGAQTRQAVQTSGGAQTRQAVQTSGGAQAQQMAEAEK